VQCIRYRLIHPGPPFGVGTHKFVNFPPMFWRVDKKVENCCHENLYTGLVASAIRSAVMLSSLYGLLLAKNCTNDDVFLHVRHVDMATAVQYVSCKHTTASDLRIPSNFFRFE
jgi:hypothetical protein